MQKSTGAQFSLRVLLLVTIVAGSAIGFYVQRSRSQRFEAHARAVQQLVENAEGEIRILEHRKQQASHALTCGLQAVLEYHNNMYGSRLIEIDPETGKTPDERLEGLKLQLSALTKQQGDNEQEVHFLRDTIRLLEIQQPVLFAHGKGLTPEQLLQNHIHDLEKQIAELETIVQNNAETSNRFRKMSKRVE